MNNLGLIKEDAVKNLNLKNVQEFYKGYYYTHTKIRNRIFLCEFNRKKAVLKVYDDPRDTYEGRALEKFHKFNKSTKITAPALYGYKQITPKSGWVLMEKLPEGKFFTQPLANNQRGEFIELFYEYRQNFPTLPHRPLALYEKLPPDLFHLYRIQRWFELASSKESEEALLKRRSTLSSKKFLSLYKQTIQIIMKEFKDRRMIYCHGHFKPHEVYKADSGMIYLIDFAHAKMYPEGYELAHIVWADYLMSADWKESYKTFRDGVFAWEKIIIHVAEKLGFKQPKNLIRASMIERLLGSILADVTATDRPYEEKKKRNDLLLKLLNHYIEG